MQGIKQVSNNELRKLIKSHILCNSLSEECSTLNVIGLHDSGKTTILREEYKKAGYEIIDINLSTMTDTYDLNGNPVVQLELCSHVADDIYSHFYVNETVAASFIKEGTFITGKQRTINIPPKRVQDISKYDKVVLLIDDYNRANSFVLAAIMELINTGKYPAWGDSYPKDFQIVLSSNFDDGESNVSFVDKANLSRMATVELVWNIEDYIDYKFSEDILLPIKNYVSLNKDTFSTSVIRRRFEHVINAYKFYKNGFISYSDFVNKISIESPNIRQSLLQHLKHNDLISLRELLDSKNVDSTFKNIFINKDNSLNIPKISLFVSNLFYVLEKEIELDTEYFTKEDFETLFELCLNYFSKDLMYMIHDRLLKLQQKKKDNGDSHYIFSMYFDIENYKEDDNLNKLIENISI